MTTRTFPAEDMPNVVFVVESGGFQDVMQTEMPDTSLGCLVCCYPRGFSLLRKRFPSEVERLRRLVGNEKPIVVAIDHVGELREEMFRWVDELRRQNFPTELIFVEAAATAAERCLRNGVLREHGLEPKQLISDVQMLHKLLRKRSK